MKIFNALFPKEKDFYKMLQNQSEATLKGVRLLHKYLSDPDETCLQCIVDAEHDGDKIRRLLIDDLNKTFITPIEREDIFNLSRTVDDILDLCKSCTEEYNIYNLKPNEHLKLMACLIRDAVEHLHEAIVLLKEHEAISIERCSSAKDVIDDVEVLYYKALSELAESDDIKYMFKMREIYKHLLNISIQVDEVANIMLDIIVKIS